MATPLTLSTRQALNPFDCLQFYREGFLAIHEAWTQDAVKEVRGIVDGLYKSAGREYGALPNLVQQAPHLRETAVFRTCLTMAKQLLGRTALLACDNALYKEPLASMALRGTRTVRFTVDISRTIPSFFGCPL